MSENVIFNDTLDNFTFIENIPAALPLNLNITNKEHFNSFKNTIEQEDIIKAAGKPNTQRLLKSNVSLDDSLFLQLPLTQCRQTTGNLECTFQNVTQCQTTSNSETIFQNDTIKQITINNSNIKQNASNNVNETLSQDNFKSLCTQEKCSLSSWGLPLSIQQKYESRGITQMFPWQAICLSNKNVLENNGNLIYSAPTSAGKTLVAEILSIKTVLERRKKVLIILPFVSVVREKMFFFKDLLSTNGVRVEGFMGSYNPPGGFQMVQIAICTMEKANGLINRCLEEGTLGSIGAVVVDEMHLLGDPSRGYLLELLLTKLQYMCAKEPDVNIQIIGMSATLPNLDELARWLKADLYTTTFRPVPLREQYLLEQKIYNNDFNMERQLRPLPELDKDTDSILQLCLETLEMSCSVLIFCPTKNWCENLAMQIAESFWKLGQKDTIGGLCVRKELKKEAIVEVLEQLKRTPVGLDTVLNKTVSFGVAFHHAGLTMDERDIIEGGFRHGGIRVLVATSTLSSGVNLPARRVIIRTPLFHGRAIDTLSYRQMIGRAGRMGKDTAGESILICQQADARIVKELMSAKLQPIESCLEGAGKLKRAILEVIASGVVSTPEEVKLFTQCTLLAQNDDENNSQLVSPIDEAVDFLKTNEFIRLQTAEDGKVMYVATSLAKACLSSSIPPEDGLTLFTELEKARQCFVLDNELHLIYLVTPYSSSNQWTNLDWMLYLDMWEKLSSGMKKVGNLVGVNEAYIFNGTRGKIPTTTAKQHHKLQIHRRFYTALALQELVNEVPLSHVASKFNCSRGMLQSLQQSASTFAGMITAFSRQLGWSNVELLISQFQDRLQFGVNRDLLDLMRLSLLNGPRARVLFNANIKSIVDLAGTDACSLENIFYKAVPFETGKERDGESEYETAQRNKVRTFWITGKQGLTEREAAKLLIDEARRFLTLEMGLAEAKWDLNCGSEVTNSSTDKVEENKIEVDNVLVGSEKNCSKICESLMSSTPNSVDVKNNHTQIGSNVTVKSFQVDTIVKLAEYSANDNMSSNQNCNESNRSGSLFNDTDDDLFLNINSQISLQMRDLSLQNKLENDNKKGENQLPAKKSLLSSFELSDDSLLEKAFISEMAPNSEEEVYASSLESTFNLCYSSVSSELFNESDDLIDSVQKQITQSPLRNTTNKCIANKFKNESVTMQKKRFRKSCKENRSYGGSSSEMSFEETPKKKAKRNYCTNNNDIAKNIKLDFSNNNPTSNDFTELAIVNVCDDEKSYGTFQADVLQQREISLSVACKKVANTSIKIGNKICRGFNSNKNLERQKFVHDNYEVVGLAFFWGNNAVFYFSFENIAVIKNENKILFLKKVLDNKLLKLRIYDCKEQLKILNKCCGINTSCSILDPRIADWLLLPEDTEKSLKTMVEYYLPKGISLFDSLGKCRRFGSISMDIQCETEPLQRAAKEATLSWHLMNKLMQTLRAQDLKLLETYETEMKCISCLINLEIIGFGVDKIVFEKLTEDLKQHASILEKQTFYHAGRTFSMSSSKEVAKVLGMYKGRKISTSKTVLETIDHPIALLVLQWRKINSIMTKMMYPLTRAIKTNRIYSNSITHHATGRISMQEPNLQNVPRDFDVMYSNANHKICIRKAFVPSPGHVFISADYCQLELRLLAHFSQDKHLCSIMCSGEDIFRSIAAKLNSVDAKRVDDVMRQRAKQICYGIIYGMGSNTLGKHLHVDEEEAASFMDAFKNTYPGIKVFIDDTVIECRDKGYVTTLAHRRRYFPLINSTKSSEKGQAERQAVNTRVQGSAADIAKMAIVGIEKQFQDLFTSKSNSDKPNLVLHIHDELLFEVPQRQEKMAARIIKKGMEKAIKISVPLPVKVKSGYSWGTLKEFVI